MMCRTERRGRSACERYQAKHLAMLPLAYLDHLPMLLQWDTYLLCFELAYSLRTSQAIKITNYLISRPKPPESRIVEADKYCPTAFFQLDYPAPHLLTRAALDICSSLSHYYTDNAFGT
ncbi:hypothetical protein ABVK25_000090 [Lepraria finkii]|uniref:Uncharacterized protein n=1 Tax=Lepraria finkii TaxID=1340010 RepID=A0ABR4BLX8_9LECA